MAAGLTAGPFGLPTIDEILSTIGDKITGLFSGLFQPIFDAWPLAWSIAVFVLIAIACVFLAYFLMFKWVRAGLLGVIIGAALWLWGRWSMWREMVNKVDSARKPKSDGQ